MNIRERFIVRVTHEPTGESASISAVFSRSERDAYNKALALLRSRIFAVKNGILRPVTEVASYDVPDGDESTHTVQDYRVPNKHEPL